MDFTEKRRDLLYMIKMVFGESETNAPVVPKIRTNEEWFSQLCAIENNQLNFLLNLISITRLARKINNLGEE